MKALELVISLAFIYLLYTLLGSIVQEFIAKLLSLRSRMLYKAISRMLDEVKTETWVVTMVKRIFKLTNEKVKVRNKRPITREFYNQPSIRFLGESTRFSKPGYLSAENFSSTLIRMLRGISFDGSQSQMTLVKGTLDANSLKMDHETLGYITYLFTESNGDFDKFKAGLESWFNEMMVRVSGWYKRQTHFILFFIGLIVAILFNIDSIEMTQKLSHDDELRNQIVKMAESFNDSVKVSKSDFYQNIATHLNKSANPADSADTSKIELKYAMLQVLVKKADTVSNIMGLGWIEKPKIVDKAGNVTQKHGYALPQESVPQAILGWLITALAISLGSTFWYDLLNKLLKLKSVVGSSPQETKTTGTASADDNTVDPRTRKG
jgi:hypothetical protein